ncbi:MAG: sulfotransferase family 2 domain-containing protein [Planctomycetota bacterium]
MLVSHQHRFIYTKTAKTAGTSVESFFERFCMPEGEWQQEHSRDEYRSSTGIIGYRGVDIPAGTIWWNHMPAISIRKELGVDIWDKYFKFCVVRNPYEKCISAYEHFGRYQDEPSEVSDVNETEGLTDEQRRFFYYLKSAAPDDRDRYVIDGEFCLDDVIRYESLEDGIHRICQRLSLPCDMEYLPTFKQGYRRPNATGENLYSTPARKQVEEQFAYEIEHFGYEYPYSHVGNLPSNFIRYHSKI